MSELAVEPELPLEKWRAEAGRAHEAGHTWFGWLTAFDAGEGDLVVLAQVADPSVPGSLRARTLVTRVRPGERLESLTSIYPGAAWCERETAELFGLAVEGFEDPSGLGLRRLLLPPDVEGHPLRKDFTLPSGGPTSERPPEPTSEPSHVQTPTQGGAP
jgi:NADH-quinone oxidoreductase subunit C